MMLHPNCSKAELVSQYESGMTVKALAEKYGVNINTLYYWLKKAGYKSRDSRFKKGINSWNFLTEPEKTERKEKLSARMSRYNPLKNEYTQRKRSADEKRRRGATGVLTHREKRLVITNAMCCQVCGITYPLTVHHRDGNRFNNKPENLEVVCFNCHYIIEYGGATYTANRKGGDEK
jgi:transposase-like protein